MKTLIGRLMAAADRKRFTSGVRRMKFRVIIEQDEDGAFVVEVPSLPGCVTQGETRDEAVRNAHEAIEVYLESLRERNEPIPPPIDEEIVEVAT